uniref:Leucine-rich repeat-containing N-terminal plant-type domain-containing protein n=1 Tax=Salix viminalis TaxID=40686 RepID=A0A6N2KGG5_SALVM
MSIVPVIMMVVSLQVWLPLGCLEEERIALLKLKESLNYPNGTSLHSWRKGDARCCDWDRVVCSNSTELISLDLWKNQIAGWVENKGVYQPFKMSKLEYLDLGYNRLDDSILSYVDGLSSLKTLAISYNRLEGLIDLKEWSSNLETLDLRGNNITKVVASGGVKMSMLEKLYLGSNRLDNSILSYVDGLSSLKTLDISYNRLEELIDLKECSRNLETLDLSGNNITKVVASGGPTNLNTLYLNNITSYGRSFQMLEAFPNLTTLRLRDNDLRGRILGDELRNLSSLEELTLNGCSLDQNSLQSLGALPSLKNLYLRALSGVVPFQDFVNLKNLELLDLSYNTLKAATSSKPSE